MGLDDVVMETQKDVVDKTLEKMRSGLALASVLDEIRPFLSKKLDKFFSDRDQHVFNTAERVLFFKKIPFSGWFNRKFSSYISHLSVSALKPDPTLVVKEVYEAWAKKPFYVRLLFDLVNSIIIFLLNCGVIEWRWKQVSYVGRIYENDSPENLKDFAKVLNEICELYTPLGHLLVPVKMELYHGRVMLLAYVYFLEEDLIGKHDAFFDADAGHAPGEVVSEYKTHTGCVQDRDVKYLKDNNIACFYDRIHTFKERRFVGHIFPWNFLSGMTEDEVFGDYEVVHKRIREIIPSLPDDFKIANFGLKINYEKHSAICYVILYSDSLPVVVNNIIFKKH